MIEEPIRKTRLTNYGSSLPVFEISKSICSDGERFEDGTSVENLKCYWVQGQIFLNRLESDCEGKIL